jgi:hypothetical protein
MARLAQKQATNAITPVQIKKIHALKSAICMDDDTYRYGLDCAYGVTSSKDLNSIQAQDLIVNLEKLALDQGVWEKQPKADKRQRFSDMGSRRGMATPPQLRKIEAMWRDTSRIKEPEARTKALRSFLERIAKVSDLRFLDRNGASAVINALTAMQKPAKGTKQ